MGAGEALQLGFAAFVEGDVVAVAGGVAHGFADQDLTATGLPVSGLALILPIDWLLDRLRTINNIFNHMAGAAIIERYADE